MCKVVCRAPFFGVVSKGSPVFGWGVPYLRTSPNLVLPLCRGQAYPLNTAANGGTTSDAKLKRPAVQMLGLNTGKYVPRFEVLAVHNPFLNKSFLAGQERLETPTKPQVRRRSTPMIDEEPVPVKEMEQISKPQGRDFFLQKVNKDRNLWKFRNVWKFREQGSISSLAQGRL